MSVGILESSVEIRQQALVKEGIKPKSARLIAKNFPAINGLDDLFKIASSSDGKKAVQKRIRGTALKAMNVIFEKRYGRKVLGRGIVREDTPQQDNYINDSGIKAEEEIESTNNYCQIETEERKSCLYTTLAFYGLSGRLLKVIVQECPWLQDFLGLFIMACTTTGAKMICSVLTSGEVSELNELFSKEYACKPLPEKPAKKHSEVSLSVAAVA